jgi:hypothetical protein
MATTAVAVSMLFSNARTSPPMSTDVAFHHVLWLAHCVGAVTMEL